MRVDHGVLARSAFEELSVELAAVVLARIAPDEVPNLREIARRHFTDYVERVHPGRHGGRTAIGIDTEPLAPHVLTMIAPVLQFLAATIAASYARETGAIVADRMRDMIRNTGTPPAVDALSLHQARRVHGIARSFAISRGATTEFATVIADAVIDGLATIR